MQRFFKKLGTVIENRRRVIIIVGLILIAVSLFGALRITMATDYETWLSANSQTYKDYERFCRHFGSDVIVVLITGDDMSELLQPDNLMAMTIVESSMSVNSNVLSAVGPTFLMRFAVFQKTGTMDLPDDPQAIQEIVIDPQSGDIQPDFLQVLPDHTHALIPVIVEGGLSQSEQRRLVTRTEEEVAQAGFIDVETMVTGGPTIFSKTEDLISESMRNMFIVALFLMFLILAVIFNVRGFFAWRWLPLGVVGIGVVYTLGTLGLLSMPITVVSMSVFPIVIGLGVDCSIQLHSRYDEEINRGNNSARAVIGSLTHIGPAIGIVLIAVCLGFVAMLFSPIPMIQDFGLMLIISIIACYAVAMFVPLAILQWRDRHINKQSSTDEKGHEYQETAPGFLERALRRFALWTIRNPVPIVLVASSLAVAGFIADSHVETERNMAQLISEDTPVMQDYQALEALADNIATVSVLVESEDVTAPEILNWILSLEHRIGAELAETVSRTNSIANIVMLANYGQLPQSAEQVKQILAMLPRPIRRNLVSEDYCSANVIVNVKEYSVDHITQIRTQLADVVADPPLGINCSVTGILVIQDALFEGMGGGRMKITLIGIGLIFLGLFSLFRFSLIKAFIAILPIMLIIGWSGGLIYLSGVKYTPLTACLSALVLGIGVEYTILLTMRYHEERGKGKSQVEAITTAVMKIGRAIIASGVTTIGGFAALLFATGILAVRDFSIMTVLNVFLALVGTLLVLPPLLVSVDLWWEKRSLTTIRHSLDGVFSELDRAASKDTEDVSPQASD